MSLYTFLRLFIALILGFIIGYAISKERLKNEIIEYLFKRYDKINDQYIRDCISCDNKYIISDNVKDCIKNIYREIIAWLNDQ